MHPIRSILVPYDFSAHAQSALDVASGLATQLGAELHLLHVVKPIPYGFASELDLSFGAGDSTAEASAACRLELTRVAQACRDAPSGRIHVHVVENASIPHAIDSEAERLGADLIAMGTHGRTGLAHALLGSIAEATTRRAPCPVMTVPCRPTQRQRADRWETSRHPAAGSF